jgi:hypothetical protein
MAIRTPRESHANADLPASLVRALTVLRLGLELLDHPALARRPDDLGVLSDAVAAATLEVLDRRRTLPLW